MITTTGLLAFALVAAVTIATPGPTVLLALHNGARHGWRAAGWGIAGAVLSDLLLVAAAGLGLGALLAASELAFSTVKWLGVVYLAWLGLALLRAQPAAAQPVGLVPAAAPPQARALFVKSLLVALGNPKGLLFFSALLPQFIQPAAPQLPQYLLLAAVFAGIDTLVMAGYALLGARSAGLPGGAVRWLDRLCGGTLLGLAAMLASLRRSA
jgi:threonine/homoserine/homoserine lactone efflux protein